MNKPFYKMMINDEKNTIFINLTDEKYKNVLAKVGNIEYDKNTDLVFDMELPQGYEKYYDDEKFTNLIQNAVFDIVATSVKTYWNEAETMVLKQIEDRLQKLLKTYDRSNRELSYLDSFAQKGYMIMENDNNELIAINVESKKQYNFNNEDDFLFLRKEIGCGSIIH